MKSEKQDEPMDLITAIVRSSLADNAIQAALMAGAPGITFFSGQGMGVKERLGYVGSLIEQEKKILFIVVSRKDTEKVFEAIVHAANISLPGEGFAFVQPVTKAVGFFEPRG